jgi:hypothetical protein
LCGYIKSKYIGDKIYKFCQAVINIYAEKLIYQ